MFKRLRDMFPCQSVARKWQLIVSLTILAALWAGPLFFGLAHFLQVWSDLRDQGLVWGQALLMYLRPFRSWLLVYFVFSLIISFAAGSLIANYFLVPLKSIKWVLDEVNTKNLSDTRLLVSQGKDDEITQISLGINSLLDRLDRYVDSQIHFVEDASHELRTPVAVVKGHLNLLKRWGKDDPDQLEESLDASIAEMDRMSNLVQEMLDLTRAGQVDFQYKGEHTNVVQVMGTVVDNFRMLYPDFKFLTENERTHSVYYVNMNRTHLDQIMTILLDNAVKYSTDRKVVHVSVSSDATSYVEIAVQDFGIGMSQEDTGKIFNRFYRVDKARSRERGGNGLGLSIAQQLVEGYKGRIFVESSLGSGSIFHVRLPVEEVDIEADK